MLMGDGAVVYVLSVDMSLTCASSLEMSLVHLAGALIFLGRSPWLFFHATPATQHLHRVSEVRISCDSAFGCISGMGHLESARLPAVRGGPRQ